MKNSLKVFLFSLFILGSSLYASAQQTTKKRGSEMKKMMEQMFIEKINATDEQVVQIKKINSEIDAEVEPIKNELREMKETGSKEIISSLSESENKIMEGKAYRYSGKFIINSNKGLKIFDPSMRPHGPEGRPHARFEENSRQKMDGQPNSDMTNHRVPPRLKKLLENKKIKFVDESQISNSERQVLNKIDQKHNEIKKKFEPRAKELKEKLKVAQKKRKDRMKEILTSEQLKIVKKFKKERMQNKPQRQHLEGRGGMTPPKDDF